jgi:hypothetical protein
MTKFHFPLRVLAQHSLRVVIFCVTAFSVVLGLEHPSVGAEIRSLELVPANAAFYVGCYNLEDAWERVAQSRALTRLKQLGSFRKLFQVLLEQRSDGLPEGLDRALREQFENPLVQDVLGLLGDMHSQEFFVAGTEEWVQFLAWVNSVDSLLSSSGVLQLLLQGFLRDEPPQSAREIAEQLWQSVVTENVGELRVPSLLVGWRVKDVDRATSLVNMLRGLVLVGSLSLPQLAGKVQSETIDAGDFTIVVISGEDIPWEELLLPRPEESPPILSPDEDEADAERRPLSMKVGEPALPRAFFEQLRKQRFVLAFGMREDWILFGFGADTRLLHRPGEERRLADVQEIEEILGRVEDQPLFLSYQSGKLRKTLGIGTTPVEMEAISEWIAKQENLPPDLREQLSRDVRELAGWLAKMELSPGPMVSATWLSSRGLEEMTLFWAEKPLRAASRLQMLLHVGGDPLGAFAISEVPLAEAYEFVAWGVSRGWEYLDYFVRHREAGEEVRRSRNISGRLRLAAGRADRIIRSHLLPALGEGEFAFVLDAKLRSRQVHAAVPYSERPLPVPEPALVVGVADREKLLTACREFRNLWPQLRELLEDAGLAEGLEEIGSSLPPVSHRREEWADIYQLEVPQESLDARIRPTLALGKKALTVSISEEHAKRLLEPKPLQPVGLIEDMGKPRIAAAWMNLEKLWDVVQPWVEHLTANALESAGEIPEEYRESVEEFRGEIKSLVTILRCLRGITVEYSVETPNLAVRRTLVEIHDLTN